MNTHRATAILLSLIPVLSYCVKPVISTDEDEKEVESIVVSEGLIPAVNRFNELSETETISEKFLFFTDPHLLSYNNNFDDAVKRSLISSFSLAKEAYDYLSLDFCLCGGDWLIQGDTQDVAKEKLRFADNQMKSMFPSYHKIMGNHDTNYQGVVSAEDSSRGDFSREYIDKVYFSETESAYYSFEGKVTKYYVLDSDLDWTYYRMNDYRWEQIVWLADQLLRNDYNHLAICIHMFYFLGEMVPMSNLIVSLCDAFNSRQEISINGQLFDYSKSKGTIHFILSGHNHEDAVTYVGRYQTLPSIQTCNFGILKTSPTFDICLIDYSKGLLNMIRVGKGESRQINLYIN